MNKKRLTYKDLEKVFGIKAQTISWRLNKAKMSLHDALTESVGYEKYEIIGNRYNNYIVESRIPNTSKYNCLCDCGKSFVAERSNIISGRQKSCGCLNMQNRHNRHKDMSGQVVNGILLKQKTDTEITKDGKSYIHYLCECPFCKKEFDARYMNIVSGNTKGCGCTRHQYTHHIDLTGKDFEFCHVNKRVQNQVSPSGGSRVMYECVCCCGNIYTDWAFEIIHGRSNCGCKRITSKGETETRKWLDSKDVNYTTQYWFEDLRGQKNLPYFFDFAILDDNDNLVCLIEYQGEQHYHETKKSIKDFGKYQREISDPAKRQYCKEHNIKLFEIAYFENVPSKCEEIFNLLYHDNTVPSMQKNA